MQETGEPENKFYDVECTDVKCVSDDMTTTSNDGKAATTQCDHRVMVLIFLTAASFRTVVRIRCVVLRKNFSLQSFI